jgi:hypothetical protein
VHGADFNRDLSEFAEIDVSGNGDAASDVASRIRLVTQRLKTNAPLF